MNASKIPPLPPELERALLEALDESDMPAPPAGLFPRILARIEEGRDLAVESGDVAIHGSQGPVTTVRSGELAWEPLSPGVEAKVLLDAANVRTWLARFKAGASLAAHTHEGDEECLVLEGCLQLDGIELRPGDFQLARTGSRHEVVRAATDCVVLVKSYRASAHCE